MKSIFDNVSFDCSVKVTKAYSTSFSSTVKMLAPSIRQDIYNIYGFVRFADEIVDTFHDYDKKALFDQFKKDTYIALEQGISLNPILHRFQMTYRQYNIDPALLDAFLYSMEMDLSQHAHDEGSYQKYIYGSAEVVGLMCLYIFCKGDLTKYEQLRPAAQSLGAAFQKVNFLRDIKADFEGLDRVYFPNCDFNHFTEKDKLAIEEDIQKDFENALEGIKALPLQCRFGVYVAYKYYYSLFKKIKKTEHHAILKTRIRIPDYGKVVILAKAKLRSQLNFL